MDLVVKSRCFGAMFLGGVFFPVFVPACFQTGSTSDGDVHCCLKINTSCGGTDLLCPGEAWKRDFALSRVSEN